MSQPVGGGRPDPVRFARADTILDAGRELLLRFGYRRFTVDDIARRAGVGKGTLYLHWRSREQLIFAVGAREAVRMLESVIEAMIADQSEITLSRYQRRFFVAAMERPVLRAIFTRDTETLDKLVAIPERQPLQGAKLTAATEYLSILKRAGLLRPELELAEIDYPLTTISYGFFAVEPLLPPDSGLDLATKADRLAEVVHRVFEPDLLPEPADYADAVPEVVAVYQRLAEEFRAIAYPS
ncbi:MAG: TetR/AcrR family transcriptional regulator [Stackebrandtia sp.]